MHEDRANLSCVVCWIEQTVLAHRMMIAAAESCSTAPAAASEQLAGLLGHKVGAVLNKLGVYREGSL